MSDRMSMAKPGSLEGIGFLNVFISSTGKLMVTPGNFKTMTVTSRNVEDSESEDDSDEAKPRDLNDVERSGTKDRCLVSSELANNRHGEPFWRPKWHR